MEEEVWKLIKYNGLKENYQVSNYGNIRSEISNKILKCSSLRGGYKSFSVQLETKKKTFKVHQIVATTFLDKPLNTVCVNHKDGNKLNNHVNNLEWVSIKENNAHAYKTGLNKVTKRKIKQLDLEGNLIKIHETIRGAGKDTNTSSSGIAKVCKKYRETAGGFKWEFLDINPNENPNIDLSTFVNITNYPNYKINNKGDIYSISYKKLMNHQLNNDGNKTISLSKNDKSSSFLVHRLVAEHFLDNPDNKNKVRRKNKNKLDTTMNNLEYY